VKRLALALIGINAALLTVLLIGEWRRRALIETCAAAHARWGIVWAAPLTREQITRSTMRTVGTIFSTEHALVTYERDLPPDGGSEGQRYQADEREPSWLFHAGAWHQLTDLAPSGTPDFFRRRVAVLRTVLAREEYAQLERLAFTSETRSLMADDHRLQAWTDGIRMRREHWLRLLAALDTAPLALSDDFTTASYRLDPPVDGVAAAALSFDYEDGDFRGWVEER
jgi:hypothetical protein